MKMVIIAIITTLIVSYMGMWLDGFMGTENSWLFTLMSVIITMGSFILYSIEKKHK